MLVHLEAVKIIGVPLQSHQQAAVAYIGAQSTRAFFTAITFYPEMLEEDDFLLISLFSS